jgi:hypothetical protein
MIGSHDERACQPAFQCQFRNANQSNKETSKEINQERYGWRSSPRFAFRSGFAASCNLLCLCANEGIV